MLNLRIFLLKDNDGILNDTGYSNPYPYTHPLIANTKASNGLPNFHCGKFDAANDSVARAIMPFLKKHPEVYARKVTLSGLFFFWPISSYWATELMKPGLGGYDYIFSHQFLKNLPVSMKAVPVMLQYGLLFIAIFLALTKYRKRFHDVISPERRGFFYYMLFIWVYAFTLLTLLEHGENMRNRLHITPYFFAMCVFVLVFFLRLRKANREKG